MATVYAKNPAELVIQNPAKKPKTKPKKKMARKKRTKKGRFAKKGSKRKNPPEFVDTGKNLFMQFGLAALASTGIVKIVNMGLAKTDLAPMVKDTVLLAGPAAAGILTSMFAAKNNAIAQGIAGGMVLASVNTASDRFLTGGGSVDGLSDTDMIVKSNGILYDQEGNAIAKISMPGGQRDEDDSRALSAGFDTIESAGNMLGEWDNSFEGGEAWTP